MPSPAGSSVRVSCRGNLLRGIPAVSDRIARLAQGIAPQFYQADIKWRFEQVQAYSEPEGFENEWIDDEAAARRTEAVHCGCRTRH